LWIGDWAQSPIPNPQSPIPIPILKIVKNKLNLYFYLFNKYIKKFYKKNVEKNKK